MTAWLYRWKRRAFCGNGECAKFVIEMRICRAWRAVASIAALSWYVCGQTPPPKEAALPAKEVSEFKGMPPRAAPTDYQAHAKVGALTIAAEFQAHAVPTPEATFNSEDYVVVEVGFFGPPDAKLKLSIDDFTLHVNEKKPLASRPYGMVFGSLKDPSWEPPDTGESKSKTGINTGGNGQDSTPVVVKMPFPLQRAMELKVQKAALREGERVLPEAGLIFFPYHGKEKGIHSLSLSYTGPAGKALLRLTP
jgi:hypothetical protein